ncbi:hypothetical protein AGLY_008823 [Aphis glycines]|uniref:Hsp70 nucleotide exchange factor FES1 n=1 Tax=Aphis glycines TaxID=307491 RepID=A0A6G0TLX1_APHGL|nr:hypothetical protein AGLY_008823 [Aphis glycines]QQL12087.1 hsp70 nucleotide exchange factor FES1 [Aphis glycines]
MEDLIGGLSSSSDDDSGPIVIMPPSFHRGIASDDVIENHHPRIITDSLDNDLLENHRRHFIIPNCLDELIDLPSIDNQRRRTMTDGLNDNTSMPVIDIPINHRRRRNNHRRNNQRTDFIEIRPTPQEDDEYIRPIRQVKTVKDMLRWTHNLSSGVIPTSDRHSVDPHSFDEERKKFLSNVFSTMSVNVQEEMNNAINILHDNNKQLSDYDMAFDIIAEYVDNIDYANDFEKLGGFHIFLPCLRSEHPTVRIKTCELITTLVQNNPYCQEKLMENINYLRALISLVENDLDDEVRVKALTAISSLVRNSVTVFWKFIELGGKDLIINVLKASNSKLQIKAVFIICSTCQMGNDVAEMYIDNGVVELISSIIMVMGKKYGIFHHDLFLSTLNQLLRMSPVRVKEICSSLEDFKQSLTSLKDITYSDPDESRYQEEKDQVVLLMETLAL